MPVASLDDHSQPRRPIFYPVVIATVMLTIVGMIGGYLLSERHGGSSSASDWSDTGSPSTPSSAVPSLLPVEGACTTHTQEMASNLGALGQLSQVLRVRTERGSVIWICQDESGNLFYHANKGGEDAEWVEGKTALFLSGVEHEPDGSFQAVASWDGTTFDVSPDRLLITKKNATPEVQRIVGD